MLGKQDESYSLHSAAENQAVISLQVDHICWAIVLCDKISWYAGDTFILGMHTSLLFCYFKFFFKQCLLRSLTSGYWDCQFKMATLLYYTFVKHKNLSSTRTVYTCEFCLL